MFGSGADAGPPGFGSVLFQPEIPVEPQSGQGKNKTCARCWSSFGPNCHSLPPPSSACSGAVR